MDSSVYRIEGKSASIEIRSTKEAELLGYPGTQQYDELCDLSQFDILSHQSWTMGTDTAGGCTILAISSNAADASEGRGIALPMNSGALTFQTVLALFYGYIEYPCRLV